MNTHLTKSGNPLRILAAFIAVIVAWAGTALPAQAIDQAMPGAMPAGDPHAGMNLSDAARSNAAVYRKQNRTAFEEGIDLATLRLVFVQHLDHVKILDSWARQSLRTIRHRQRIDGKDPLYIALDMAFRQEAWLDRNVIYVESPPVRDELAHLAPNAAEASRIRGEGLVSAEFLSNVNASRPSGFRRCRLNRCENC